MRTEAISTDEISRKIKEISAQVRSAIRRETGMDYDERLVERSIRTSVANSLERIEESLPEMFTSPNRREFQELTEILARKKEQTLSLAVAAEDVPHTSTPAAIFAGNKPFAKEKLVAMIEYLTGKGHQIYKTSLNKLLFYSDLTYFYLRNQGMSGAVYYNRRFGPVADPAGPILDELIEANRVNVVPRTQTLESSKVEAPDVLTNEEQKVLDWVADTYGSMTATEISHLSHGEKAYRYTDPNEPIAYAYAKFLIHLPPKDLLEK